MANLRCGCCVAQASSKGAFEQDLSAARAKMAGLDGTCAAQARSFPFFFSMVLTCFCSIVQLADLCDHVATPVLTWEAFLQQQHPAKLLRHSSAFSANYFSALCTLISTVTAPLLVGMRGQLFGQVASNAMHLPTAPGFRAQVSELRELRITAKDLTAELARSLTDHTNAQVHAWAMLP